MLLDRAAILAANDLKTRDVDVPEWGGVVRVRQLSALERDAFFTRVTGPDGKFLKDSYRVTLVQCTIVGEGGEPQFSPEDVAALQAKSSIALDRVFLAADELNTVNDARVEAAAKN